MLTEPFGWWDNQLYNACATAAAKAFPNEAAGFICMAEDHHAQLVELEVNSSPIHFQISPQSVVDFAYKLLETGWTLLASFHSHPLGTTSWSILDHRGLGLWTSCHVLLVRDRGLWSPHFYHFSSESPSYDLG